MKNEHILHRVLKDANVFGVSQYKHMMHALCIWNIQSATCFALFEPKEKNDLLFLFIFHLIFLAKLYISMKYLSTFDWHKCITTHNWDVFAFFSKLHSIFLPAGFVRNEDGIFFLHSLSEIKLFEFQSEFLKMNNNSDLKVYSNKKPWYSRSDICNLNVEIYDRCEKLAWWFSQCSNPFQYFTTNLKASAWTTFITDQL